MKHPLPAIFVSHRVSIALVGCGGNGTQMLTGLARMDVALRALGHPGFEVTTFDPDRVSESNIGRQLFSPSDVGHYKANLLTHRLNVFFGLDWKARPLEFPGDEDETQHDTFDLVIGCVDSAKSRRAIYNYSKRFQWFADNENHNYWLDVGNLNNTGQAILGQFNPVFSQRYREPRELHDPNGPKKGTSPWAELRRSILPLHLPNVTDLFPQILDARVPEVDIPSCSLAEALESQDLFINQAVTTFGLQLLWMFFRQGGLDHHGYFVNLASGGVSKLPIDKTVWERFNPAIVGLPTKSLEKKKPNASRVKRKQKPTRHARRKSTR